MAKPFRIRRMDSALRAGILDNISSLLEELWRTAYDAGFAKGWDKGYAAHEADLQLKMEVRK